MLLTYNNFRFPNRPLIAGLRTRNNSPLTFQQLVSMSDGHEAHAAAGDLFAQ